MLRVERFGFAVVRCINHEIVPPMIAAPFHFGFRTGALIDDDSLHRRTTRQRFVDGSFERYLRTAPVRTILGDHRFALRVVDTIHKRVRREASEHD